MILEWNLPARANFLRMRWISTLLCVLLGTASAWAGCGPRGSDSSLMTLLVGLLAVFLLIGPCIGAVIGEVLMTLNGHRFRLSRVFLSIVLGACATAVSGLALSMLGQIALVAPVLGGFVSLYHTSKMTERRAEEADGIGFPTGNE